RVSRYVVLSSEFVRVHFFFVEKTAYEIFTCGVQTCALPICDGAPAARGRRRASGARVKARQRRQGEGAPAPSRATSRSRRAHGRSEERRVGKECSYRGARAR